MPIAYNAHECLIWNLYQAIGLAVVALSVDYILVFRGKSSSPCM